MRVLEAPQNFDHFSLSGQLDDKLRDAGAGAEVLVLGDAGLRHLLFGRAEGFSVGLCVVVLEVVLEGLEVEALLVEAPGG
jgi:hypothetical protein